jgi:hypothetical protein
MRPFVFSHELLVGGTVTIMIHQASPTKVIERIFEFAAGNGGLCFAPDDCPDGLGVIGEPWQGRHMHRNRAAFRKCFSAKLDGDLQNLCLIANSDKTE